MPYRYHLADVFTDRMFGGNPLAVFPDGSRVPPEHMQALAAELNLSETVFVLPPRDPAHAFRLRIFTPRAELPFAGHPTVGTACVLAETGRIPLEGAETRVVLEEGVGPVPVTIHRHGSGLSATFQAAMLPQRGPASPPAAEVARMLSLEPEAITAEPVAYTCGVRYLCVPLRDVAALGRAHLDTARWQAVLADFWAPQLLLFTEAPGEAAAIRARMFAPGLGVPEDPATGSAAAALAGYLADREAEADGTFRRVVIQGVEMGRAGRIELEVEKRAGAVSAVRVGGRSVLVGEGALRVPRGSPPASAEPSGGLTRRPREAG